MKNLIDWILGLIKVLTKVDINQDSVTLPLEEKKKPVGLVVPEKQSLSLSGIMVKYEPRYFKIEEWVPQEVYQERGELSWELLNPKITYTWDELRRLTGKRCTINNWKYGGSFHNRGLRLLSYYKDNKNHYSQHIFGNGGDGDVEDMSPQEVVEFIIKKKKEGHFKYLVGIEVGVNWTHLDCRPAIRVDQKTGLFFFDKKGIVNWETYIWP